MDAEMPDAHLYLGIAHARGGKTQQATAHLERALQVAQIACSLALPSLARLVLQSLARQVFGPNFLVLPRARSEVESDQSTHKSLDALPWRKSSG